MLTKTQIKIMQWFVGNITKTVSIRQVQRELKISYPLLHRSITRLIKTNNFLKLSESNLVHLNYQDHHDVLAYVEYLRRNYLLAKRYAFPIKDFLKEALEKFAHEYFIIILFGSSVLSSKPKDFDLMFIFENNKIANDRERAIEIIASNNSGRFHIQVVGTESVFEMASKRNQTNILNELLNKHIMLYGAENFYRLLNDARQ